MDNLLNFPQSTIVNKNVPKNAFWQRANNPTWLKEYLTKEFLSITWLYKLTAETLNVSEGKDVAEIDVFLCKMKASHYGINAFCGMDKLLPRYTLFVIEHGERYDLIMHHKERTTARGELRWSCGVTEWQQDVADIASSLHIEGQTMDAVYTNLLGQIAHMQVASIEDYKQKKATMAIQEKLTKQIDTLENKVRRETQQARKYELFQQLSKLKEQLKSTK